MKLKQTVIRKEQNKQKQVDAALPLVTENFVNTGTTGVPDGKASSE